MLADIKTKLKPGGILFIDESVPQKSGQLHRICNKPMLTQEEIAGVLARNGFENKKGPELMFRKKMPMRKIYAFSIIRSP